MAAILILNKRYYLNRLETSFPSFRPIILENHSSQTKSGITLHDFIIYKFLYTYFKRMSRDAFLMDEITQVIYLLFTKVLDQFTRGI